MTTTNLRIAGPAKASSTSPPTADHSRSTTPTINIVPWPDPILDRVGHDPRSRYVERFWLPTLGPTARLLLRHLADRFDEDPDGLTLPVAATNHALGFGPKDLDSDGAFILMEPEHLQRPFVPPNDAGSTHEFAEHHVGPIPTAEPSERRLADPRLGSQEKGDPSPLEPGQCVAVHI